MDVILEQWIDKERAEGRAGRDASAHEAKSVELGSEASEFHFRVLLPLL